MGIIQSCLAPYPSHTGLFHSKAPSSYWPQGLYICCSHSLECLPHTFLCLANSHTSFRAQLQILWGKFHWPSTTTHYMLSQVYQLNTLIVCCSLPSKRSSQLWLMNYLWNYFSMLLSPSKHHTRRDQIFLISYHISTTVHNAWLVLSWQLIFVEKIMNDYRK